MAISINPGPFDGVASGDVNRIRRITFLVGPVKTVAHLDNRSSGSVAGYEKVRNDSSDPANIQVAEKITYIDEEA